MSENPPQDKKIEYLSLDEKKNEYDISPEELSEKKKEFFDYIDSVAEEGKRSELVRVVSAVAEHSVEDAITLLNKNRFTSEETFRAFNDHKSFIKNNVFTQALSKELKTRLRDATQTFDSKYNQDTSPANSLYQQLDMYKEDDGSDEYLDDPEEAKIARIVLQPQESEFEEMANDYYSHYLHRRDFNFEKKPHARRGVNPDILKPSPRMEPELEAKKHLKGLLPYMEKQYLTGEVSNILIHELKRNDPEVWEEAVRGLFDSEE